MIKLLYMLHVLATVVWVGGMFFAHQVLRPVVLVMESAYPLSSPQSKPSVAGPMALC